MFSGCRVGRRKRSLREVGWESASFRPPPPFQMHAWVLSPDFLCLNWICGLWLWHHIHTFNFNKKKREKKTHWERHYSESAFWHRSFRDGTENYFLPVPTGSVRSHPLFCFLQDTKFFFTPKRFWPITDLLCPLGKKKTKQNVVSWRRTRQVEEPEATEENTIHSLQSLLSDPGRRWQRAAQPRPRAELEITTLRNAA